MLSKIYGVKNCKYNGGIKKQYTHNKVFMNLLFYNIIKKKNIKINNMNDIK